MGRGRRTLNRKPSRAAAFGCDREKKAGQYSESGIDWEDYERSQNLNKNISDDMVHKMPKVGYAIHVPCSEDVEVITVGHPDAELLKVFLLKDEKAALKDFAAKQGQPMYHLVRQLILDAIAQKQQQNKSA